MSCEPYLFKEVEKNVYMRKAYGNENLTASIARDVNGSLHGTTSTLVRFSRPVSKDELQAALETAMIRFRHFAPGIAFIACLDGEEDNAFKYVIPSSLQEAQDWARKCVRFESDGEEQEAFLARHERLRDNNYWSSKDHKYCLEILYSAAEEGSWHIDLSASHANQDGRTAFMILDTICELLAEAIDGEGPALESLKWGEEVSRLSMPAPFVWDYAANMVPSLPALKDCLPPPPSADAPPKVSWKYDPLQVSENTADVAAYFTLSKDETAAIHAACKAHDCTLTQFLGPVLSLATTESALRRARQSGEERWKEVAEPYTQATHFRFALTYANKRPLLPKGHESFKSEHGTPWFTSDAFEFLYPIEAIRKLIQPDLRTKTLNFDYDRSVYWDELVVAYVKDWKEINLKIDAFQRSFLFLNFVASQKPFNTAFLNCSDPSLSSLGDLTRLGLCEQFRPSFERSDGRPKTLVLEDVLFSQRLQLAPPCSWIYQYDDQLRCTLATSGRYTLKEDIEELKEAMLRWIRAMI